MELNYIVKLDIIAKKLKELTHLRSVWIFSDSVIFTNFLLILAVKKFENWSLFYEVIRRTKSVPLLGHAVNYARCRVDRYNTGHVSSLRVGRHHTEQTAL